MKKRIQLLICLGSLLLLLCSCDPAAKAVGTWQSDGTLEILGGTAPFEHADQLIFRQNGTAAAAVGADEIEFTYSMTDDTLTLSDGSLSWGVPYTLKGNTLSIGSGDGYAIFTKAN